MTPKGNAFILLFAHTAQPAQYFYFERACLISQ